MAGKKPLLFDHGLQSLLHAKENDLNLFEGPAVPIELASDPVPERMSLSPESGDQTCTVTIDDVEILVSFIHESQDHLSDMEEKILSLRSIKDNFGLFFHQVMLN